MMFAKTKPGTSEFDDFELTLKKLYHAYVRLDNAENGLPYPANHDIFAIRPVERGGFQRGFNHECGFSLSGSSDGPPDELISHDGSD